MSLTSEEITRLSRMSESQLEAEVGRAIYASQGSRVLESISGSTGSSGGVAVAIAPKDLEERIARAIFNKTFSKFKDDLRKKICVEWDYCRQRTKYKVGTDLAHGFVSLIPIVIGSISLVGAFGFSLILIRMGLDNFCRCDAETPASQTGTKVGITSQGV